MITEFRIRQELEAIGRLPDPSTKRARRLLRLARRVREGAVNLRRLSHWSSGCGDGAGEVRFHNAMQHLIELHDQIREQARAEFADRRAKFSFDQAPTADAFPRWQLCSERERGGGQ